MKRWPAFAIIVLVAGLALIESQRQKPEAPVSPDAVLFLIADTQRDLTRLPVSFTRMSDEDEIKIGDELAGGYLHSTPFSKEDGTSRALQAYVNQVGGRVASHAHRKLPYKFHYVAEPDFINAFALPGGHVFIGRGLIALMDSEDELAGVLGHEVEHIDHYHCAERIQTEATLRKIPLGELVAIPVEVFEAGYSKAQELEADREGTRLAVSAGYSPLGAIRLFQTFDRLYREEHGRAQTPEEELSRVAWQTLEGYFRSHPLPSERVAQIQKMMSDQNWENLTHESPLAVEYVFLTERAEEALAAKKYPGAEIAAARSLALRPEQPDALEVLTAAQFAQMNFTAAAENYRKLIEQSPSDAGDFGRFAIGVASHAQREQHFDQAAKFAAALLDLQPNNSTALVALTEAQMAATNFDAAGASYQKLKSLYPDVANYIIEYARSVAARALAAHDYQHAAGFSTFWLTIEPGQQQALIIQGNAELALGNFASAAKSFRSLLELTPKDKLPDIMQVENYAEALSATESRLQGAKEFQSFMIRPMPSNPAFQAQMNIEWAGLMLMAGKEAPAAAIAGQATGGEPSVAPESLERLGWWYYRAGRYQNAIDLLRTLAAQRPGDASLRNDLGWVWLEQNKLDDAVRWFLQAGGTAQRAEGLAPVVISYSPEWNTPTMGLAVAFWRNHRADDALAMYGSAVYAEPRWLNEHLVRAFYSPGVAQFVAEMQAEQMKRVQAKLKSK